ncbi:MAG TPA: hydrogenase maturation protease, partial [Acidimicrobiales bacterium]|nr:hydrogenase maturation protease [Acidimicrobiales bacterium]
IGNIFLGDDAFGVEVARRLGSRKLPDGVAVVDFGIRALDLTYALLDGYEAVVLVDAAPRGGPPGTLYVLEPERGGAAGEGAAPAIETHNMDPVKVLRLAEALGGRVERLVVVGCEPSAVDDPEELRAEMSAPVSSAVGEAIPLIESLVGRLLRGESIGAN